MLHCFLRCVNLHDARCFMFLFIQYIWLSMDFSYSHYIAEPSLVVSGLAVFMLNAWLCRDRLRCFSEFCWYLFSASQEAGVSCGCKFKNLSTQTLLAGCQGLDRIDPGARWHQGRTLVFLVTRKFPESRIFGDQNANLTQTGGFRVICEWVRNQNDNRMNIIEHCTVGLGWASRLSNRQLFPRDGGWNWNPCDFMDCFTTSGRPQDYNISCVLRTRSNAQI